MPPINSDGHDFGDRCAPIQVFGAGHLVQHAALDHADKVLLFQLIDGFGVPVNLDDGILQIWITPEDLAAGRLESAFGTGERT